MKSFLLLILGILLAGPVAQGGGPDPLRAGFQEGGPGIRAFWWWLNGDVTEKAITRDLEEMRAKGFSGALIFDADGSGQQGNTRVPAGPVFGSREWTKLFVHACREAARLKLELSLNIQSGWNLGGPSVTEEDSAQQLVWSKTVAEGGRLIDVTLERPRKADTFFRDVVVLAVPAGDATPLPDLELKSATRELGMSAPDCRFLLESAPGSPGGKPVSLAEIHDLTDMMAGNGHLRWQAPPGRWEIVRIGHAATGAHVSTHSEGWDGRVVDYLSPGALDRYWTTVVDPLLKAIGPLAGTTLRYIHTDSWEGGGMNWTPGIDRTFLANRGYDLRPWLAVVTGRIVESREASDTFLADFRKTIGDLVAGHYGRLAELASQHGMGTHPECSGPHAGPLDGLKNYGRGTIMMSEFWSPSPHRPDPASRFFVKQAASAAHTYGKRLVGAEAFTTIGPHWNDTPWQHMKTSFDREFCAGLNLAFVHTFTCSPPERGLPGNEYFAGTHFNPQITWWNEAPEIIRYFNRCQFIGQKGTFVADVLHYYGDHIPNVFGSKALDPGGALPGHDYDVLSEELLLAGLQVKDGALVLPSGMRYRVLTLPDHGILSPGAMKKIHQLVHNGATVIGPKPRKMASLEGGEEGAAEFRRLADELWGKVETGKSAVRNFGEGRMAWGMTAREWLAADKVAPDVEIRNPKGGTVPETDWIHYQIDDADFYFVAETAGLGGDVDAIFRTSGCVPELWNPVDGSIMEATEFSMADGRTRVPLRLGPYDSLFVVFRRPTDDTHCSSAPNQAQWREVQAINGPWDVTFQPGSGGSSKPVRFDVLTDWTQHPNPAIRDHSGRAVYQTVFETTEDLPPPCAIELGMVLGVGIARVTLNGDDLGIAWRPPFRFLTGDSIKPGRNELKVEVVNSWHNRVLADSRLPESKRTTRTNIRVATKGRFAWQPEPSGLSGPVRICARSVAPGR